MKLGVLGFFLFLQNENIKTLSIKKISLEKEIFKATMTAFLSQNIGNKETHCGLTVRLERL